MVGEVEKECNEIGINIVLGILHNISGGKDIKEDKIKFERGFHVNGFTDIRGGDVDLKGTTPVVVGRAPVWVTTETRGE